MNNNNLNNLSNLLDVSIDEIRLTVLNAIKTLCYEKKEFTLVSGRKSDFYIDLRRISFDGDYLYYIGRMLYEELTVLKSKSAFDVIAGVPVGGMPLISSILINSFLDGNTLKSVVIRKEKKDYGKGNMIEPVQFLHKDAKIMIVEDVVTTGGSILKAVKSARNEGYIVKNTICIVDREEGGKENLEESGIDLISLFTKADILA
ncbi:MAG: orotate phosphoribosyltransferase [bacterium]